MLLKFNVVSFVGSNELVLGMCCWDLLSFRVRGSGKTNSGPPIVLVIPTLIRFLVEWSIRLPLQLQYMQSHIWIQVHYAL